MICSLTTTSPVASAVESQQLQRIHPLDAVSPSDARFVQPHVGAGVAGNAVVDHADADAVHGSGFTEDRDHQFPVPVGNVTDVLVCLEERITTVRPPGEEAPVELEIVEDIRVVLEEGAILSADAGETLGRLPVFVYRRKQSSQPDPPIFHGTGLPTMDVDTAGDGSRVA
jgi:hypothetical protein